MDIEHKLALFLDSDDVLLLVAIQALNNQFLFHFSLFYLLFLFRPLQNGRVFQRQHLSVVRVSGELEITRTVAEET
jgi:hypothetical protein